MTIQIEPLTSPDDIDGILTVEAASFTNGWTREMYLAELNNPGVAFFLLARDRPGNIVAFCSYWCVADELHINNLAVLPGLRRQGIASTLLTRVLEEGRRLGATRAMLEVRQSNHAAIALYSAFGFTPAGLRTGYYNQPSEDALVLWREDLTRSG